MEVTEQMVNEFNSIMDKLSPTDVSALKISHTDAFIKKFSTLSQIQMMKNTLLSIERALQPGLTRFNWHSLGIAEYARGCKQLLKSLVSVVQQVNQLKIDLNNRIAKDIECYNFCSSKLQPQEGSVDLPGCKVTDNFTF